MKTERPKRIQRQPRRADEHEVRAIVGHDTLRSKAPQPAKQVRAIVGQDTLPPAAPSAQPDCAIVEHDALAVPLPRHMADLRAISTRHPGDADAQLDFDRCVLAMMRACGASGEAADDACQEIRLFADLWYNGLRDQAVRHANLAVEHLRALAADLRTARARRRLAREARVRENDYWNDDALAPSLSSEGSPLMENRAYPEVEKALAEPEAAPQGSVPAGSVPAPGPVPAAQWLVRLATREALMAATPEEAVEAARRTAGSHVVRARVARLAEAN